VAEVALSRGFRHVLLLGTKYLMEGPVYAAKLAPRAIEYEIPETRERERINALILDELVYGRFEVTARSFVRDVIAQGKQRGADAVVLGCTELPLLISDADSPLPILDSTRILARAALRKAVGEQC
jgi:aspartate racemase